LTTEIHLAHGLVGLHELKRFELIRDPEAAPFLRLCSLDDQIEFVAIEPAGWVPDYAVEVGDDEAEELHIDPIEADAQVLALVTVHRAAAPPRLTMNLLAPLVVNRSTGEARQVVMADAKRFSTAHPLAGIEG
jgi:flagellar assembly factor FliW